MCQNLILLSGTDQVVSIPFNVVLINLLSLISYHLSKVYYLLSPHLIIRMYVILIITRIISGSLDNVHFHHHHLLVLAHLFHLLLQFYGSKNSSFKLTLLIIPYHFISFKILSKCRTTPTLSVSTFQEILY